MSPARGSIGIRTGFAPLGVKRKKQNSKTFQYIGRDIYVEPKNSLFCVRCTYLVCAGYCPVGRFANYTPGTERDDFQPERTHG